MATQRTRFIAALSFVVSAFVSTSFISHANAQTNESAPGVYSMSPVRDDGDSMSMIVNLRAQRAYVYRDGVRIRSSQISSGKPGYRTPTGTFTVLEKERVHHSNKYDNAPMPYMQRLTWGGVALHGGHVPGFPASHGCIRLPMSFARWLYSEPTMGMRVTITHEMPASRTVAASTSMETSATMDDAETDSSQ
jgi:lipoprotein-anchoring transpeptidase ErfK/SrfK